MKIFLLFLSLSALLLSVLCAQMLDSNGGQLNSEPLTSNSQLQFIGNISIGTPPQNLTVLFNINSTSLIVSTKHYNPGASSTHINPTGSLANDTVRIAGLSIEQQTFVTTTEQASSLDANIGAVFGLGYAANDVNNIASPIYNIYARGLVSQQLFALSLVLNNATNAGSQLSFGQSGVPPNYVVVANVNTSSVANWQFNLNATYINGTAVSTNATAVLSSSSNATAVPDSIYSSLQKYIQQPANADGSYIISCNAEIPLFVFTIGTANLTLNATDFMLMPNGNNNASLCILEIQNSNSGIWSLGTTFLAKYYTIFDVANSQISFAAYVNSSESETTTTPRPIATTTQHSGHNGVAPEMCYWSAKILSLIAIFLML